MGTPSRLATVALGALTLSGCAAPAALSRVTILGSHNVIHVWVVVLPRTTDVGETHIDKSTHEETVVPGLPSER